MGHAMTHLTWFIFSCAWTSLVSSGPTSYRYTGIPRLSLVPIHWGYYCQWAADGGGDEGRVGHSS